MIERLLAPGSIPELACAFVSLRKKLYAYFPLGPSSLPVVAAQLDKKLANRTQKRVLLRWCGLTEAESLVHTNDAMAGERYK